MTASLAVIHVTVSSVSSVRVKSVKYVSESAVQLGPQLPVAGESPEPQVWPSNDSSSPTAGQRAGSRGPAAPLIFDMQNVMQFSLLLVVGGVSAFPASPFCPDTCFTSPCTWNSRGIIGIARCSRLRNSAWRLQSFAQLSGYFGPTDLQPDRRGTVTVVHHGARVGQRVLLSASNPDVGFEALTLPSYVQVARNLLRNGYYSGIISAIQDCAQRDHGFVVIDSPSGSGKTLAGVALRELDHTRLDNLGNRVGSKFRVAHLVWPTAVKGQGIYREILDAQFEEGLYISGFFQKFKIFAKKYPFQNMMNLGRGEFIVMRELIQRLFTIRPNMLDSFSESCFAEQNKFDDAILVLFVDEVPDDPTQVQLLLILREALKLLAGVVAVYAGTNARAANVVSLNDGYSESASIETKTYLQPWSLYVTRLPKFDLDCSPDLKHLWESTLQKQSNNVILVNNTCPINFAISTSIEGGGNPRLIIFAVIALVHVVDQPIETRFLSWQRKFSSLVVQSKFSLENSESDASGALVSQLNLLLEGPSRSFVADLSLARHFAYRVVPDNGVSSCTGKSPTLAECGGWLYIPRKTDLLLGQTLTYFAGPCNPKISGKFSDWSASVFAPMSKDPLLYFSSCRSNGYFSVSNFASGLSLRTHEVALGFWRQGTVGVNNQNPSALSNTGSLLEAMTAAALMNAAAVCSNSHVSLNAYLVNLIQELGVDLDTARLFSKLEADPAFDDIDVPRCLFPGTHLAADFLGYAGLVSRMANRDRFDVEVVGLLGRIVSVCCAVKDRDQLSNPDIIEIVGQIANVEGAIGIIVVRGRGNRYWSGSSVSSNMKTLKQGLSASEVGKVYFVSSAGQIAELDVNTKARNGRIIFIQVPLNVLGRDPEDMVEVD